MGKKDEREMIKYFKILGYQKVRERKHMIFKNNENGKIIVVSRTPSDYRSRRNIIRDCKSQLRQAAVM